MTPHTPSIKKKAPVNSRGFALLEVLIVLFILGLLAAMAWSGMGLLDDSQRRKITLEKMEMIRTAIMGPQGIYDAGGRRVLGGYVGDMKKFPDLWEARAEIRPDFSGNGWPDPDPGLGQAPSYILDPARVYFRPSGAFVSGQWQRHRPYRKLFDDAVNNIDHTGGLETENEGQPRGRPRARNGRGLIFAPRPTRPQRMQTTMPFPMPTMRNWNPGGGAAFPMRPGRKGITPP